MRNRVLYTLNLSSFKFATVEVTECRSDVRERLFRHRVY